MKYIRNQIQQEKNTVIQLPGPLNQPNTNVINQNISFTSPQKSVFKRTNFLCPFETNNSTHPKIYFIEKSIFQTKNHFCYCRKTKVLILAQRTFFFPMHSKYVHAIKHQSISFSIFNQPLIFLLCFNLSERFLYHLRFLSSSKRF